MKRIFLLFSCALLVNICNGAQHFRASTLLGQITPNDGVIYKIHVIGDIKIHHIKSDIDPTVAFTGNDADLENIEIEKDDGLITISMSKAYNSVATIFLIVNTKNVHSMNNNGVITFYSKRTSRNIINNSTNISMNAYEIGSNITPNDGIVYKIKVIGDIELHRIKSDTDPTISFTGNDADLENIKVDKKGELIVVSKPKFYKSIAPTLMIVNTKNVHSMNDNGVTTFYMKRTSRKKKNNDYKKNNTNIPMNAYEIGNNITPNDGVAYKIKVIGDIELHRINSDTDPTISFTGNDADLENIKIDKKGALIVISKPKFYKSIAPSLLIVNTKNIHSINYQGITIVYANNFGWGNDSELMKNNLVYADDLLGLKLPNNIVIREIKVHGDMGLKLVHNKEDPVVAFKGNPVELRDVKIDRDDDLITITKPTKTNSITPIYLVINTRDLHSIYYQGSATIYSNTKKVLNLELESKKMISVLGSINIRNLNLHGEGGVYFNKLNSNDLSINIQDSIFAIIEGKVKLTKLNMSDCAWLKLFWNDGEYLKITGTDKAFAQIAGRVSTIDIDINEYAHFNGRFLRTDIAYVKTYDDARVDIQAKSVRNTLAEDSSNIYTYNAPKIKFDNMITSGSVMDR